MKSNYIIKSIFVAILLSLLSFFYDSALGVSSSLTSYLWGAISNLFVIILLAYYIVHSSLTGLKLTLSVFIIYYAIGHINILIEAYIFNVTDRGQTVFEMLRGLFFTTITSPVLVYLFEKWEGQEEPISYKRRSVFGWIWRVMTGDLLYLIFYIIAGMTLQAFYPEFMAFYKDKIPPFELMINTQFLRGLIFVLIAILILRTSKLPLTKRAILVGLVFSILGGIAPLIWPNELMPAYVRLGHGFEVGISNFLYGLILGYLLGQKRETPLIDET